MRLSRDLDQIKSHYDAIVVGSGYGAGVAASRLARMGLKVAVLERGREIPVGEFPDSVPEATAELQFTHDGRHEGRRDGLYDLHLGRDMHVLVGCGLGGTSLINANVSLPPDPRVWEDPCWPAELFADETLNQGFERAEAMLRPQPYPGKPALSKLDRMDEAAKALNVELARPPINVVLQDTVNAAGVKQPACTLCGDCCSGCNVGAKTTVQMSYLPDAYNHGAEIFTNASVRFVRRDGENWRVFYVATNQRRDHFKSPERSISASILVLGAGSLGSTEVLLRSRANGLPLSERLGAAFSGNGDVLAFAWNGMKPFDAVGVGYPPKSNSASPGPCITGLIDLRDRGPLVEGMVIEEGVLPSGLSELLPGIFGTAGPVLGKKTASGILDEFQQAVRRSESWLLGAYKGAMNHTATYLVMAHDDAGGRLELQDDRVRVSWPGVASQAVFKRIEERLLQISSVNDATYIRNPIQSPLLGKNMISVHPLGGCGMGHTRATGVIDHRCRVFDASAGSDPAAVHEGLYVVDGSAMPRSLGVNPLLSITAIAERSMIHLAQELGRPLDVVKPSGKPVLELTAAGTSVRTAAKGLLRQVRSGQAFKDLGSAAQAVDALTEAARAQIAESTQATKAAVKRVINVSRTGGDATSTTETPVPAGSGDSDTVDAPHDPQRTVPAGVEFTERMAGYISDRASAGYEAAAAVGKSFNTEFSFTVTVRIADIDRFLTDPMHQGTLTGTAICKQLSPEPLDVSEGVFRLMRKSQEAAETRLFEYIMILTARDGRRYQFRGQKNVHDDMRFGDLLRDTTTLYIDIAAEGATANQARGVLVIHPQDFAKQMRTLRGFGGRNLLERNGAVAKFGALFAGTLFDVYGNIFAPVKRFDPARVRKKRGLRAGEPEVHFFQTADGKTLRLTRYNNNGAAKRGPVLLTHGLGVSSLIFSIDTIDTNLLEFLVERGLDCWLLDFRASIDLPYARNRWTADDCAKYDYQPAVDLIRQVTGAPSVQVVAHCFGATTFVMSMLGGYLNGVRSAVISQIATDVIVPFFPQRFLAYLRTPALFDLLKIDAVNARATTEDGAAQRLADELIRVAVPFQREERSRNATSNRITALYGQLYETDQLNALTFESGLAEMFGEANIDAFKQLALIARKQVILAANGDDAYLPFLERLAIPMVFVHGAENACFLPESTAKTVERLTARNGARFYERHVIPNYGHIDCIFGKNAASDVYPKMYAHLDKT